MAEAFWLERSLFPSVQKASTVPGVPVPERVYPFQSQGSLAYFYLTCDSPFKCYRIPADILLLTFRLFGKPVADKQFYIFSNRENDGIQLIDRFRVLYDLRSVFIYLSGYLFRALGN